MSVFNRLSNPSQLHIHKEKPKEDIVHQFEVVNRGPGVTAKGLMTVKVPTSTDNGDLVTVKATEVFETPQTVRALPSCKFVVLLCLMVLEMSIK